MSRSYFSFNNLLHVLCISLLFSTLGTASAQEAKTPENVFTLGEIEITDKAETSKNITTEKIYSDEMRQFDRNNVAQALNLLSGVTLTQTGARNEQTVSVRGFDLKRVPIFLDGIPIYVPYDGYPDLGRFTTFDLSEIVVEKGFASVLYGPNTEGGAINMVSKRPVKIFEGDVGVGYGTGNTFNTYANLGTKHKLWYLQAGGSYASSSYFRLSDNFRQSRTEDGGQRDNSYYRDRKYNFKVGFTPADGHEYALSYINQHGVKGTPVYTGVDPNAMVRYWEWPYWDKESYYFTSRTPLGDKSYFKTRLYYDKYRNSLYSYDNANYNSMKKGSSFMSDYDDHTRGGSIEAGTTLIPMNTLKVAFHYKEDFHLEHNEPAPYQHFKDQIWSAGIEDTFQITKKLYTIMGVSYDTIKTIEAEDSYNTTTRTFGYFRKNDTSATNPQIGFFYDLTDTAKIYASIANKSRLPTIKEKYSYKMGKAIPNPDLKAEKSTNYEIGYRDVFFKKLAMKAAVFYSDVTDMMLSVTIPKPGSPGQTVLQTQNVGDVRRYGFELDVSAPIIDKLDGGFNYTYICYDNRTNSEKITDIPKHKIFAYAKYSPIKGLTLLGDIEYNSQRYSSTDGIEVARAFSVTNFKTSYEFARFVPGLTIEGGVSNIFDRDYAISEGYPMAGRSYFANMRYSF